jgi:Uma2 family endonuclease
MPATALLTSEQYLSQPEEFDRNGNRIKDELIGGEVVKMPPPSHKHDLIKNHINRLLIRFLDANPQLGLDSQVEMAAKVGKHDTFVPDVGVVSKSRLGGEQRVLCGAPELAIEVVSPTDMPTKLKPKVDAYLHGGSKTVWVILPDSRSVMIHSVDSVRELRDDQLIEDPLLPGFSAPVSRFFDPT